VDILLQIFASPIYVVRFILMVYKWCVKEFTDVYKFLTDPKIPLYTKQKFLFIMMVIYVPFCIFRFGY